MANEEHLAILKQGVKDLGRVAQSAATAAEVVDEVVHEAEHGDDKVSNSWPSLASANPPRGTARRRRGALDHLTCPPETRTSGELYRH